jgi:hypothetical protein
MLCIALAGIVNQKSITNTLLSNQRKQKNSNKTTQNKSNYFVRITNKLKE